jgi:hypothetical protein
MFLNIDTRQIRDESLIPKPLDIEYQALFLLLRAEPKTLGAQKNPELKRHVESGKFAFRVDLGPGKIVHAVAALADNRVQLFKSRFRPVFQFAG